ncbi:MAG: head decoration protein [Bosea sp.]|uniref:head decoration protein n=1 Tax=Bosea sp. (in: a-proteobacteria) TaxID=1871050 RepID=UPI0023855F4C|nr:head decoration protein [Bosea sp. (in: a-proteobacteria)]MCP4738458.1 head decoration protein [Bosea sp. (in: a-proteobacteria)]
MFIPGSTVERQLTFGEVFYQELDPGFSRETGVISSGSGVCRIGLVLGQVLRGALAAAKTDVAGAGKGVITLANPAFAPGAEVGKYAIVFIEPAANAGTFEVRHPDGTLDGTGNVGVAYDGSVKFTIADGGTDFVAGDIGAITLTAADGSLEYVPHDPAADDGSQYAIAVLGETVDATDADRKALVVRRMALVRSSRLIFKAGISAPDKAGAVMTLASQLILARDV